MNQKKLTVTLTAVISAVVVLFGGTFAWQSTNQSALNRSSDIVANPGGRLHDDFNGENKDVYVENFADEPIFARIQLSEYLAFINNKGIAELEKENVIIGGIDEAGERIYEIHYFDEDKTNRSDAYWRWKTGGQTVYMPTFNKNKDSLISDINGTYQGPDGIVTDLADDDRYKDYKEYFFNDEKTGTEIYDADYNSFDEVGSDFASLGNYVNAGNIFIKENVTHKAKATAEAKLISMADWLEEIEKSGGYDEKKHGNYWVYDTDGWVYWSAPIMPDTATGLLLDEIELKTVMDDSWYYAINVTAQFVTANDIGKSDFTGFYDAEKGSAPTGYAETLLELITGEKLK